MPASTVRLEPPRTPSDLAASFSEGVETLATSRVASYSSLDGNTGRLQQLIHGHTSSLIEYGAASRLAILT